MLVPSRSCPSTPDHYHGSSSSRNRKIFNVEIHVHEMGLSRALDWQLWYHAFCWMPHIKQVVTNSTFWFCANIISKIRLKFNKIGLSIRIICLKTLQIGIDDRRRVFEKSSWAQHEKSWNRGPIRNDVDIEKIYEPWRTYSSTASSR